MQKIKDNPFEVLSTKMSKWMKGLFEDIAAARGTTPYRYLQTLLDAMIINSDIMHPWSQMSETMKSLIHLFESKYPYKEQLNVCQIDEDKDVEVGAAIYCLQDRTGKKLDVRSLMVDKPFMDTKATFTFNRNKILERFLCLTFYPLYRKLRVISAENGYGSISQLLHGWCDREEEEHMMDGIFGGDDYHMGRSMGEQRQYKKHRNMTNIEQQTTINFNDNGKD